MPQGVKVLRHIGSYLLAALCCVTPASAFEVPQDERLPVLKPIDHHQDRLVMAVFQVSDMRRSREISMAVGSSMSALPLVISGSSGLAYTGIALATTVGFSFGVGSLDGSLERQVDRCLAHHDVMAVDLALVTDPEWRAFHREQVESVSQCMPTLSAVSAVERRRRERASALLIGGGVGTALGLWSLPMSSSASGELVSELRAIGITVGVSSAISGVLLMPKRRLSGGRYRVRRSSLRVTPSVGPSVAGMTFSGRF